jgi:Transposase DDE domain
LETQLRAEVEALLRLSEQSDQPDIPDGLVVGEEITRREDRLARLAKAKAVLQARATERLAAEQEEYEAKLAQRAERERTTGRRPGGRGSGESAHRRMGPLQSPQRLSRRAEPTLSATLSAMPSAIGTPEAAAFDAGYFGPATLAACAKRNIEPSIATGRDPHHLSWQQRFAPLPDPPAEDASTLIKMAYKLKTAVGKAIYGARKCTVEPVIGIIKEVLGFRQFSLRGELAAAGEWCLVCLAFNLKRFHTVSGV